MKTHTQQIHVFLYLLLTALLGYSYWCNSHNFGKRIVGLWGAAAILLAAILLIVICTGNSASKNRFLTICFALLVIMQLPPILCWIAFGATGFEFWGVILPGLGGIGLHFLMILWGLLCARSR